MSSSSSNTADTVTSTTTNTTTTTMNDFIAKPTTTTSSNSSISNSTSNSNSNKRQRLSSTGEYNKKVPVPVQAGSPVGSIAAGMTMATNTNSNHGIAAVTGLERTTTTATTIATRTPPQLPTFDKLAKELCKIVDTDHYSREDAKRALATISRWGDASDDDDAANSDHSTSFLRDFSELGGIQRVLLFVQHNQSDPSCVMVAMKVIMACTHRPSEHPSIHIATEITRSFILRNGIDIVLTAGKEFINNENENTSNTNNDTQQQQQQQQQLHALRWIWMVLMNVTEKTSTFDIVEKNQLLAIFDSFLETMTQLGLRNAATANTAVTATTKATITNTNNNNKISDSSTTIGNTTVQLDACGSGSESESATTDSSFIMNNIVQRAFSSFCSPTTATPRKRSFIETTTATAQEEQHPQGGARGGVNKVTSTATTTTVTTPTVNSNKSKQERDVVNTKLTSLVLEDMFITLLNVTHNGKMTRDDFQGMDLISKCSGALKKSNDDEWIDNNKEVYMQASNFFVLCSNEEILSTKQDFESAFPLIVECIRRYPETSFHNELFDFVRQASLVLVVNDEKSFLEKSGIFGALATVLQLQDVVSEATKNASHQLLKELLK